MNTMQQLLPGLGREIRRLVVRNNLSATLLRSWAVLAAFAYGLLALNPPIEARYWLLLLVAGIALSILLTVLWMQQASNEQQLSTKPWILHWSCFLVVLALQMLQNMRASVDFVLSAEAIASQCLLLGSLGFMTAGLYLRNSLLPVGLALAACYLYTLTIGVWAGVVTGAVCAASLWSLSGEPAQ